MKLSFLSFINYNCHAFIPFADKLPGIEKTHVNLNEQKRRRSAALRMKKNIKEIHHLTLDILNKMELKAKRELFNERHKKKQYFIDQLGKASFLIGKCTPGLEFWINILTRSFKFKNLTNYIKHSPSHKDTLIKITQFLVTLTSPLWGREIITNLSPLAVELLTTIEENLPTLNNQVLNMHLL